MKRYLIIALAVTLLSSLACPEKSYARKYKNMRDFFDDKGATKAHISNIENTSGDNTVDARELKGLIGKALEARISHNIEIVSSESDADLVIDIVVTKYFWTDKDPVDRIYRPISAVIDMLKTEDYAWMQMDVIITDTKNGRKLWDRHIKSTITNDTMSREASYAMSYERITKILIKELFKRNRS